MAKKAYAIIRLTKEQLWELMSNYEKSFEHSEDNAVAIEVLELLWAAYNHLTKEKNDGR